MRQPSTPDVPRKSPFPLWVAKKFLFYNLTGDSGFNIGFDVFG